MSDIAVLKEMFKNTAIVPLENSYDRKKVILEEPPPENYSVTINGMPDNDEVIVIKADAFKSPDTVFQGKRGECKRADFVIIANTDKKKFILCIELKATKDSEKEIIQQLTGTQCFVTYCQKIGQTFWKQPDFLYSYQYRFVSISHTKLPKQKTRIEHLASTHDCPERMMKIAFPHYLEFNHLVGK